MCFCPLRPRNKIGIKSAIDQVYSVFLPKGNHPLVYMDLQIEPKNLDVNVHPTKHEVNFLYENEIIEKIKEAFEAELIDCPDAKEKYTQKLLPGASNPEADESQSSQTKELKIYAKDIIRYDFKEQKLEKFFGKSNKLSMDNTTEQMESPDGSDSQNDTNVDLNAMKTSIQHSTLPTRENSNIERKYVKCQMRLLDGMVNQIRCFFSLLSFLQTNQIDQHFNVA